jgi:hypothetical protein
MNQCAQCLYNLTQFLHDAQRVSRHRDCHRLFEQRRKAHFIKELQFASFSMKWRDKINSTRRNKLIFKRRSANAIQIHSFLKHNHLKDASLSKHDWFDIHDEEITKEIHTLHDEIEYESKCKSYFDIHKIDDNRKKKTNHDVVEHERTWTQTNLWIIDENSSHHRRLISARKSKITF